MFNAEFAEDSGRLQAKMDADMSTGKSHQRDGIASSAGAMRVPACGDANRVHSLAAR